MAVDLREVKEIRPGRNSKDFDKWADEARKMDKNLCFVIFYGSEFKLHTLSITGKYMYVFSFLIYSII